VEIYEIMVSIITVTREREDRLLRCVASVVSQDYPDVIEHIIVVDDRIVESNFVDKLHTLILQRKVDKEKTE
jgi:glycosyltransferase involved in cell wall biosynthesis